MHIMIPSLYILFLLLGSNPALSQLPPEIAADAHLLRAEQAIRDGDSNRARAEIEKINLLQKKHELDLSEEFHFRAAKAAAVAGLPEQTLEAVVKYLTAVGRGGPRYVEALELMNQAQDEIAGRKEPQAISPDPSSRAPRQNTIEVQSEKGDLLDAAGTTGPKAALKCDLSKWNTEEIFKMTTVEGVKACIVAGADLNDRDKWKRTPLHWAASENGNADVIDVLFKATAETNTDWYWTSLHGAILFNEDLSEIQALLASGADPKARTPLERTPLHWAASNNENPEVVKALLDAGVDPNARDENQKTPLFMAVEHNENPVVVKTLLAGGANLHARDGTKNTPLHSVARNKNPAVLRVLLAAGADPKARNETKNTPLHSVARNENPAALNVLLAAGADPKARNETKSTPLHWAAQLNKNPEVLKVLLAAGADPNARDKDKSTPLHWAAQLNKNPEVLKVLLAAGADPNARGKGKDTPLHWAVGNENLVAVETLLAAGADPNAEDVNKSTPLHQAAQFNKKPEVLKVLLAAGADPKAQNRLGYTPLDRAERNENPALFKALLAAVGAENGGGTENISMTDAGPEKAKKTEGVDSFYTLSGDKQVTNPVPIVQTTPSYTQAALAAEAQGVVWIQCIIRRDGRVDSFKVIQGLGYGLDEQAIREISENWRFKPGMLDGKPVDVLATIEVQFNLRGKQDPESGRDRQMQHLKQIHLRRLQTN